VTAPVIERDNRIHFIAAAEAVIVGQAGEAAHKLAHIRFHKNGAIFVQAPYFPSSKGVVSEVSLQGETPRVLTIDLAEGGKATSHLVKYSHPVDGRAHFSQTGKVITAIRRQSFRLDESIGKLFQLNIYHPSAFERLGPADRRKNRAHLVFEFARELPTALAIGAEWRRKRDLNANLDSATGDAGPVTVIRSRRTGERREVMVLGQPAGFPLRDHVLAISCGPTQPLEEDHGPLLLFLGGLDPHEETETHKPAPQTGLLSYVYPVEAHDDLVRRIGSIDYRPVDQE